MKNHCELAVSISAAAIDTRMFHESTQTDEVRMLYVEDEVFSAPWVVWVTVNIDTTGND